MDNDLIALQEVRECLRKTRAAQKKYYQFTQEQVDAVCQAMVDAALQHCQYLADLAVDETHIGVRESKYLKNHFAIHNTWERIKNMKSVGIIESNEDNHTYKIAEPYGVVAAIIPVTNPTSTALFKILIALKTHNGIVISPHPKATHCISEACRIMEEAAINEGAPEGIITCLKNVTLGATQHLMTHEDTDLILATGGSDLVKAAYSAGNPAYGVGPGNVPVFVHHSADFDHVAACLVNSKTFDNGTICASEQSLICESSIAKKLRSALEHQGAYIVNDNEVKMLEKSCTIKGKMNPDVVGRSAYEISELAGFHVPKETTLLVVPYDGVGKEFPLSMEILCPLISFYEVSGEEEGLRRCREVLEYGGMGHTFVMHANDNDYINRWAREIPVHRFLVNTPSTQGAIGFSVSIEPSMTLGCGSYGKNISGDNISAHHLMLVKQLCHIDSAYDKEYIQPMTEHTVHNSQHLHH